MTFMKLFLCGAFACLGIFLFVTAPPELPEATSRPGDETQTDVVKLFDAANAINEAARLVYTRKIVGAGKAVNLKFGEDWNDPGVDKGPLPALFLRLVARQLERHPEPLGLYLGSDEPINRSNLFSSEQLVQFQRVKATLKPEFSSSDASRAIAMYPDFASAKPCVVCHNEHVDSPKVDWKIGDVMGATTWTFPAQTVSETELLLATKAVYASIAQSYENYLEKTRSFKNPVSIGRDWPDKGQRSLPDTKTFMDVVLKEAGAVLAEKLLTSN